MNFEQTNSDSASSRELPETPIGRWAQPFIRFSQIESISGLLLLSCTAIAMCLANSPWSADYARVWDIPVSLSFGAYAFSQPLHLLINDGLMSLFFFVVGLEIKREFFSGELRDSRKAALPIIAAAGGMIVPAIIFLLLQSGQPGAVGWGIPVATDIAFVAGVLALFGTRIPSGLRVMLMSLAIADDIGAILLIAFLYSSAVSWGALGFAVAGFGMTYLFNRIGVRHISIYVFIGIGIWFSLLKSGIHPTVGGVLLGFMTPSTAWVGTPGLPARLTEFLNRLVKKSDESRPKDLRQNLNVLSIAAREGTSPLERLEYMLHPWVAFLILPLFVLANAGIRIELSSLTSPIVCAVAAGLVVGKPLGIVLFSWMATLLGLAKLPAGVNWKILFASSCLAGIGFTMSLFIAELSLAGTLLEGAKLGTLLGSAMSALIGGVLLLMLLPAKSVHNRDAELPKANPGQSADGSPIEISLASEKSEPDRPAP